MAALKEKLIRLLRRSEKHTGIDMVYFASGNVWFVIGRGMGIVSGFILTVGFANLLPPHDYGVYKYVLATAGLIGTFTLGGIVPAIQRALARGYSNVIRPLVTYATRWNTAAFALGLAVSAYYFLQGNVQLGVSFIFVSVWMLFSSMAITKSFFASTGEFRLSTYFGTARTIVPVAVLLTTLLLTKSIVIIICAYITTQILIGVITYYLSLRYIQPTTSTEFVPESKRYSLYMSALGFIITPAQYIDQFLLWHFLGPVQLAVFTIAQGPAKELRNISDNFVGIAFPKLARRAAQPQVDAGTVPKRTRQLFYLLCVVVLAYIVAAPFLFNIFFPAYLDAIWYSQIIALSVLLQPRTLADTFLFAHSGIADRFTIAIPSSVIRIILFFILIPTLGILGAIIASFVAELINTTIIGYRYWKFTHSLTGGARPL